MKPFFIGAVVLATIATAAGIVAYSQERPGRASEQPVSFDGSWHINRAKSTQLKGEPPLVENITIREAGGVQHYTVDLQNVGAAKTTQSSYEAKFNDGIWHPQTNAATGQPSMELMMIKVDERTHYRVMRDATTHKSTGVMMRRLAEDGKSYVSTILGPEGVITLARAFERNE